VFCPWTTSTQQQIELNLLPSSGVNLNRKEMRNYCRKNSWNGKKAPKWASLFFWLALIWLRDWTDWQEETFGALVQSTIEMSGSRAAVLKSEDGKITVPLPLGTTALGRTNLKLDDKRVSRTQGTRSRGSNNSMNNYSNYYYSYYWYYSLFMILMC
jgi:hypothetical protein